MVVERDAEVELEEGAEEDAEQGVEEAASSRRAVIRLELGESKLAKSDRRMYLWTALLL